jgi:hypothetical protein
MNQLHSLYTTKQLNRIQYNNVIEFINNISPRELYNLIKNYRINKQQYGNGNFISKELKDKILSK